MKKETEAKTIETVERATLYSTRNLFSKAHTSKLLKKQKGRKDKARDGTI